MVCTCMCGHVQDCDKGREGGREGEKEREREREIKGCYVCMFQNKCFIYFFLPFQL